MTDADERELADSGADADSSTDTDSTGGKAISEATGKSAKSAKRPNLFARIALFFRQVVAELKKVIWPTRRDLISYTWIVLIFCVIMSLFVAACDFLFGQGVLKVFGG